MQYKELSKKSTSEWLKIFAGNVPAAPILDVKSSLENEFVKGTTVDVDGGWINS